LTGESCVSYVTEQFGIYSCFVGCDISASTNTSGGEKITEVSRGGNGNSSSSESGSLGISINLANLVHPVPPPSTTTATTSVPLKGILLFSQCVLQHP